MASGRSNGPSAARALARELELPVIFRTVVEAIAETFGYTQVSLYLLEGDELALQHQVGYDQVIARVRLSTSLTGRDALRRSPRLASRARTSKLGRRGSCM